MGSEAMLVGALFCGLAAPLVIVGGLYVAARAWRTPAKDPHDDARETLEARLARGEIDVEEYYERESALRSAQPSAGRHRRGR